MTTTELQAIPRNIAGLLKSVDSDNKAWLEQTKPKLDHPVGYFVREEGDVVGLIDYLREKEGQAVNLVIAPDRVKDKRTDDGSFSSYWWSIRSEGTTEAVQAPAVQAPPKPTPTPPTAPGRVPSEGPSNPFTPPTIPPNPAALGACHNHAVDFIVRGILPVPEGRELFGWLRELRDRFYREINQAPVMPLHYCYQHDEERRQGQTGAWGHQLPKEADEDEDSYCIEGREGWRVFDANQ